MLDEIERRYNNNDSLNKSDMLVVLIGLRSRLFCLFNKLMGINPDPKMLTSDRGNQIISLY